MLLTLRKPGGPDPTTDHEPPTTVTKGTQTRGRGCGRPDHEPDHSPDHGPGTGPRQTNNDRPGSRTGSRLPDSRRQHPGRNPPATGERCVALRSPAGAARSRTVLPNAQARRGCRPALCAVVRTCRLRRTPDPLRSRLRNTCHLRCAAPTAHPRTPRHPRGRADHEPDHSSPVRKLPDRDRWSGAMAVGLVGGAG